MNGMTLGRYVPGSSTIHRLDPRTKMVLTLLFMAVVALLESYAALLALLLFTLTLGQWSGLPAGRAWRGLRPILGLACCVVLANAFLIKGTPLAEYAGLRHISREGLDLSARMVIRLYLLVSGAAVLTASTTPLALTAGVESLMKPLARLGMPIREMAMMLSLALRFLPTLAEEARRIGEAQAARSGEFAAGRGLCRPGNWLPLLVPVVAAAFRRGDDLATAMEARGYRGCAGRTTMRRLVFSGRDLACTGGMALLMVLVLLIDRQLT